MTKFYFWFSEFKKVVQLQDSGKSLDDIKQMNLAETIIKTESFRQSKSLGNEVGYYIFDYPPGKSTAIIS